jgi:type II secretory pathway pseudopilin PulG
MEVVATIVIMGVVFAIASSTWFGAVESRRVDSATNQVVADLRLAHTSAINQLKAWEVVLADDSSTYQIGPTSELKIHALLGMEGDDVDPPVIDTPDATLTIVFEPDGSASADDPLTFGVHAPDGDPCHEIEVNSVTSRVEVSRNAC